MRGWKPPSWQFLEKTVPVRVNGAGSGGGDGNIRRRRPASLASQPHARRLNG